MRLLVTRPLAEAERTAAALQQRGHDALIAPVLTIAPVADAAFDPTLFDAIVMTSGNAARALMSHPVLHRAQALPVFAVGGRTAQAARDAGFSDVMSAEGDAADLLALVRGRFAQETRLGTQPGTRLLYLAGSDRSRDLAAELGRDGIRVETLVVYRADAAVRLSDAAAQAIRTGTAQGVLHYSRRSTVIFLDCADAGGLDVPVAMLRHYCLSPRAAEPLNARHFKHVAVATHPDENALFDLIAKH
jgi:uroporphyrinogen-III synthase